MTLLRVLPIGIALRRPADIAGMAARRFLLNTREGTPREIRLFCKSESEDNEF